jgi:hypothetical protein
MFSHIKRLFSGVPDEEGTVALQPPDVIFSWPASTKLIALDDITIGIPAAILGAQDLIGSVILCDTDADIHLPTSPGETMILLRLKSGMSASLTKSCQAVVISNDKQPKRIRVIHAPIRSA